MKEDIKYVIEETIASNMIGKTYLGGIELPDGLFKSGERVIVQIIKVE